ncbi:MULTISPECIES: S8 family serine peptidase [unclassified Streptomyces]|uniref:S8 family serine peptidase n=1 Tax=unclassified Streptomyces TaxID=2593676 RepID=UPI00074806C9|nr:MULTISPECIES: S8 family serine peptidase [unclassified Streptomyces]KUL71233.1 serine protease [Streptomyces sp. NRRL WC-3604]KUL76852.1 serine protease [Streptomyces sp. NRRL WC-3605]
MRPAARLLSGAGLAAALLLPTAVTAHPAPRSGPPVADGTKGQELPAMPSALDADAACTAPSRERARRQDWSRQRLDLDRTHGHGIGAGATVALIDTGVAPDADGLDGRVTAKGAAAEDCVGHGTFLAGLIAGRDARLIGVAPGARILALRGTDTRGRADAALVAAAVRAATEAGADVIAVTVALPRRDKDLSRAVADARRAGAVVVAAATPDPPTRGDVDAIPPRVYWPAGEPGVLSVADMLPGGLRPERALPTTGIDLAAPGAGVVSGGPRGDGHYLGAGASVAAAFAAGAAAVVRAAHPDDSPEAVNHRLTATAYPAGIPQLDAYAAVTTVLGDAEAPAAGDHAAERVVVRDTSDADSATDRATLLVLLGSGAVLAVLWAAFALPRARARGWRPARAGDGGATRD